MAEKQESPLDAVADGLGCLMMMLLIVGVFVGMFFLRIEQAKQIAKDLQHDMTTRHGYVIGRVKSVETWKAEKFVHKEGDMTLTLDVTDRCRVTFEDGRTKELLGMPKEPIPTDKDVAITWAKYDLFLEAVDAEEFKKRLKEEKDKQEQEAKKEPAEPTKE